MASFESQDAGERKKDFHKMKDLFQSSIIGCQLVRLIEILLLLPTHSIDGRYDDMGLSMTFKCHGPRKSY